MSEEINLEELYEKKILSQKFLEKIGYKIKNEPLYKDISFDDFKNNYLSDLFEDPSLQKLKTVINEKLNFPINAISILSNIYDDLLIFFYPVLEDERTIGKKNIVNIMKLPLFFDEVKKVIIITHKKLNNISEQLINQNNLEKGSKYFFQIFEYDKFNDIYDSPYSPNINKIYRGDEADRFLEENKLKRSQLHKFKSNDIIVKMNMGMVGDIFEILEEKSFKTDILNKTYEYRVVSKSQVKKL